MGGMGAVWVAEWGLTIAWELALFASFLGVIFALDDIAVDALWLGGVGRRPTPLADGPPSATLTYAILIPAWREAGVIGPMLGTLRERWGEDRYRVYVGAYPNDVATLVEVTQAAVHASWLQLVVLDQAGPTTKGDCLNALWRRLAVDRQHGLWSPDAVIVHDAEDIVAAQELAAHDRALADAEYSQLPVLPLVHPKGRWWSGHYLDEFAEAHGKELLVREAIGGMLPTAGVGFAVRTVMLDRIAGAAGPFAGGSLTEDYELGIRLARAGARGRMLLCTGDGGALIATRAYFPHHFATAVRQKTRWMQGVALDGWHRLGWDVPARADPLDAVMARWMLWRDRRSLLCALALLAGYAALLLVIGAKSIAPDARLPIDQFAPARWLATVMLLLVVWRLAMRSLHTARLHGWRQGLLAVPRQFLSNIVMIACGWRALLGYGRTLGGAPVCWDKTAHHFPALAERPQ